MFDLNLTRTERHILAMGEREYALAERFEEDFGADWEMREQHGERFLSEWDFAPDVDVDGPSNEDWDAFLEMSWVDPAERWL